MDTTETTDKCAECGVEIEPGAQICPNCWDGPEGQLESETGSDSSHQEASQTQSGKQKRRSLSLRKHVFPLLVVLLVATLVGTGGYLLYEIEKSLVSIDERLSALESDVSDIESDVSGIESDVSGIEFDVSAINFVVSSIKSEVSSIKRDVSNISFFSRLNRF